MIYPVPFNSPMLEMLGRKCTMTNLIYRTEEREVAAKLEKASKQFVSGDTVVHALKPTYLAIHRDRLTLIMGPSGSGKTTVLSLLGGVMYPTSGEVYVNGLNVTGMSERQLAKIRLENIGFIFQAFNLINPLTVVDNVMIPLELLGHTRREAKKKALDALARVNMEDRARSLPKELSGGQAQRVAIARTFVSDAPLLLCDEPTASLDEESAYGVMDELHRLSREGRAVAVVTHDERLKQYADRILKVHEGTINEETERKAG